jgi:hypothetical protein
MKSQTYKRGQVEWALWRYFRQKSDANGEPPPVFRTRIKRLLDLDRAEYSGTGFAFSNTSTSGQGKDAAFSVFDAFCLAIAMDLLDAGFKQSEVVFFLSYTREDLAKQFKHIMQRIPFPSSRSPVSPEDAPGYPTIQIRNISVADRHVYMVTGKIELKDAFTNQTNQSQRAIPAIRKPDFYNGGEALKHAMFMNPTHHRKIFLVELYDIATRITDELNAAPKIRRGRR